MSLRDTLKATVAGCTPYAMQHATFQGGDATGNATPVQQLPANPHGIRVSTATVIATAMQQGQKSSATFVQLNGQKVAPVAEPFEKLQVARTSECNLQQGALTAQRLAKELIAAAMRRCDELGDGQPARQAMRDDCLATPVHLKDDLLAHFQAEERPLPAKEDAQPVRRAARLERLADPAAWRELAAEYHRHHFQCPQCKVAGRGAGYGLRCGVGAALWANYQNQI